MYMIAFQNGISFEPLNGTPQQHKFFHLHKSTFRANLVIPITVDTMATQVVIVLTINMVTGLWISG